MRHMQTRSGWLIVIALAVTGFSMRTAVTSIGPVLAELQHAFHMSSSVSGALTTLPVVCFALLGAVTPRLSARVGLRRLLALSLVAMTVGLVARAAASSVAVFFLLSVLALTGGAITNVVLPALIKEELPNRIRPLTALYTATLALGMTGGAALTVPIGSFAPAGDRWRVGLAFWALFGLVAVLPWLATLRRDRPNRSAGPSMLLVARSPTAWLITMFFAFQAFQAYVAVGWFARLLRSHGISPATAGLMVAVFTAVSIPVYFAAASLPQRWHRPTVLITLVAYVIAYLGLLAAPRTGAWLWMVLIGIGNAQFPLALVMIGMHSRDPRVTGALSAFVQSIGYLIGGVGPLLFGVLEQATGGWTFSMLSMVAGSALGATFGFLAAGGRFVDNELDAPAGGPLPTGPRGSEAAG